MKTGDPYKILGLQKDASPEEIRKAYRSLVKKYHPDRNPSTVAAAQFLKIQSAYEQLSEGQTIAEPEMVEQTYRNQQSQYEEDLQAYKQQRDTAREKLRQKKQHEEEYKIAYLARLKNGPIGRWHRTVSFIGTLLFLVLWIDFFLPERAQPIEAESFGLKTYGSVDGHQVQLFQSTDGRSYWVSDYLSQNLPKVQNLSAIETPWLHQVKSLRFQDGLYQIETPVHFSFYWAHIWISLVFIIPILAWYFASADIIFVAGSFLSRYAILAFMMWFLFTENRFLHLLSFGQL